MPPESTSKDDRDSEIENLQTRFAAQQSVMERLEQQLQQFLQSRSQKPRLNDSYNGTVMSGIEIGIKLNDENYQSLAHVMKSAFQRRNLWNLLTDDVAPLLENQRVELMFMINRNIESSMIPLVLEYEDTPREAWKVLELEAIGSGQQDTASLLMEFALKKLQSRSRPSLEQAKKHFTEMTFITRKLKCMGFPQTDIQVATTMLLSKWSLSD